MLTSSQELLDAVVVLWCPRLRKSLTSSALIGSRVRGKHLGWPRKRLVCTQRLRSHVLPSLPHPRQKHGFPWNFLMSSSILLCTFGQLPSNYEVYQKWQGFQPVFRVSFSTDGGISISSYMSFIILFIWSFLWPCSGRKQIFFSLLS